MDKQNYEFLKSFNFKTARHGDLVSLAYIIDDEIGFKDTDDVLYFFEKFWKWEEEVNQIIKEYEQDLLKKTQCKDCKFLDGICTFDEDFEDLVFDCKNKEVK